MEEKIISILSKKDGYFSGEELSRELKISRQALWKHIHFLMGLGYDIAAVPHLGYRLISIPDRLYDFQVSQGLKTKSFGRKMLYFDSLSSTMDMANQLALKGLPEGTVVLAETQTKGRGRLGRFWHSPKYKGLYFSLILKPRISVDKAALITLLAGVSISEAVRESCAIEAQIKWPNDIMIANKKAGGILTEIKAEVDEVGFMVIGVGLNINNDRKSLVEGAISLKEATGAQEISRAMILQSILKEFETNYSFLQQKGPKAMLDKWRRLSVTLGRRVRISSHDDFIEGEAFDIDTDGGLLIRNDSGVTQKVMAGDITFCR